MFVFITLFGCCACMYCCALSEKKSRARGPDDTNNLNAYLVHTDNNYGSSQPVVVTSQPVVMSKSVDNKN
jgi:hypothetical protein